MMRTNANEGRQEVRREHDTPHRRVREPAAVEDIQQFRNLFERPARTPGQTGDDPIAAAGLQARSGTETRADMVSSEMLALLHSHRLAFEPAVPVAPTVPMAAPGLADLIERHVKQLLVSDPASAAPGDTRVMLRLADSLLPGTDLTLTRSESGWILRADVSDARSREALERCSSELVARFESNGLGTIAFETGDPSG